MTAITALAPTLERGRWLARVAALIIVGFALFEVAYGIVVWGWLGWFGQDLGFYTAATSNLLTDGTWYLPRQLAGPYPIAAGDVLYPPVTAILFAPWLALPAWTFTAIPVGLTAWAVARMRPAWWAWPLLAACLVWPDTQVKVIAANPGLWIMAALALGLLYRWPAAFVLLKPTLALFALVGAKDARWWLVVALLALASLPVLSLTLAYPRVLLDAQGGGLFYSLWDLPLLALPLIAWATSAGRMGEASRSS